MAQLTTRDRVVKAAMEYFVHTPSQVSASYVAWAEERKKYPGIPLGVGPMNNKVIPAKPGDLIAVLARPGHGKTSYMTWLAKETALDIKRRGKEKEECVVFVSLEQVVEEVDSFFQSTKEYTITDMAWGRAPAEALKKGSVARARLPIWLMGDSVKHAGDRNRPLMTLKYIYGGIAGIYEQFGIRPILVLLDYLQVIPMEKRFKSKTEQVMAASNEGKALAKRVVVPIVAGVQAARDVDNRRDPLPTMRDAQWASQIEQDVDKQIALLRPAKRYEGDNDKTHVEYNDVRYAITDSLFIMRLLKQRMDAGYGTFPVNFDPVTWIMSPMVEDHISL